MPLNEHDELAQQWFAMMIKDEADNEHDIQSTFSTFTQSFSDASSNQQEQRDPAHSHLDPDGDRLLESYSNVSYLYSNPKNFQGQQSQRNDPLRNRNSKTDFFDGVTKNLSELSNNETTSRHSQGSRSILKEKGSNGWSIHDSHRRAQESRRKLQEQSQRRILEQSREALNSYRQNDVKYEERKHISPTPFETHSKPSSGRRSEDNSVLRSSQYLEERDPRNPSLRRETHSSRDLRSQHSAATMPAVVPSSSPFQKTHSSNINKSLENVRLSLMDDAMSPGRQQVERGSKPPKIVETLNLKSSSQDSDKYNVQPGPPQEKKSSLKEEKSPRLAFSSSKDAGNILQHFMPNACGRDNGDATLETVMMDFFDPTMTSTASRNILRQSTGGSNYGRRSPRPGRPRSHSHEPKKLFDEVDRKLPKTKTQQNHQQEILRNARESQPSSLDQIAHDGQSNNFEAVWGSEQRDEKKACKKPQSSSKLGFQGVGGNAGIEVLQQLARCNAPKLESPLNLSKFAEASASPVALGMFEKIQQQLRTKVDSSGFPEEEQRIQEKLDAVRARSMRNAQIFQQMDGDAKDQSSKEKIELSFASFGEKDTDLLSSININSESENSTEKNIKGKRLDHIFDFDESIEKTKTISKTPDTIHKSVSAADSMPLKSNFEDDKGQYMYVAYSQFGADAQKILKLCGHNSPPSPDLRRNEVQVKINASTISATDCAIRRGEWKHMSMDPYIIPGVVVVGKVMGREKKSSWPSSSIEAGDTVVSLVQSGGNARYICLQKKNIVKVPKKLNPRRVACLAETYLSAFQALHLGQRGGMRYQDKCLQGQSILVMDGYSPFGKAVIELSRIAGASLCYALILEHPNKKKNEKTDMHQKYKKVEQWGGVPLSNEPQDWLTLIGRQIDIFVTTVDPEQCNRENDPITAEHWKALKKDGSVHAICTQPGLTEAEQRDLILGPRSSNKGRDTKGFRIPSCRPGGREKMADRTIYYNLFDAWNGDRAQKATVRKDLDHLMKLMEIGLVHPDIADVLPLSKIGKAQRSIEHKKITGEGHLICSPWMTETKETNKSTPNKPRILDSDANRKFSL